MRSFKSTLRSGIALLPFLMPTLVMGQDAQSIDTGDTAWILTASALVLFMTIPGLSLFYAGLVRGRNVLSVLMHCFVITALMSVIWLLVGYTMAFSTEGMEAGKVGWNAFVGGFDKVFLKGVSADTPWGTIPEPLFFMFQMTFFIITPALIVGAFAERMKFSAMLWFVAAWSILVYLPVCHMVWGGEGAFFFDMGVLDFAGGIVVHITAGMAALVACIMVGKRQDYPKSQILPHNLPMTVMGAGMLWVGWFGFNGGSALGAVAIGFVSTGLCYWMCTTIKSKYRYDDSLDVFGVHGVGGFVGTILVAVFAAPSLGGKVEGLVISKQLGIQLFAAVSVAVYALVGSYAILKVLQKTLGLRVSENDEIVGLDLNSHGESGYND